jgi:hypothetical protein
MPSALTKMNRTSKSRTRLGGRGRPRPVTPIKVTACTAASSLVTVTFDQAVILNGTPDYAVDVVGVEPVSAALTSPNVVAITFSGSVAAATALNIPPDEPSVRNGSGGFVSTSTFPC